ncbi:MAG: hypothetical protein U5K74_01685 [Gemmatimonadaceae bacterium]|nr:hypothetical protein [Gemmatimonadaceae bacterium]
MASLIASVRLCSAGVALAALLGTPLRAQRALLPLDDLAYTYIDALQARGMMRDLPLIERPYTVGAVRSATAAARRSLRDAGSARWLDAIDAAAAKYAPGVTDADSGVFAAGLAGYGVAQTSGTRDLMQSDRVNTLAPGFTVRALLQSGPFTAATRVLADRRMRVDPEFLGRRDRVLSARTEDGYLGFASRFATVEAGRVGRSWALPGQLGLMVSNGAYSYDHLYVRLGTDRLHLSSVVARLDNERLNFATDTTAQRYFSAHRLGATLGQLEIGISESVIYGGVARGFQPSLANPVAPIFLTQYSDGDSINVAFGADALWRSRSGLIFGAQVFVDDFQIDRCDLCGEPPGLALALSTEGVPLPLGGARAFASYTRVNSLTYRAPDRFERYTSRAVGLGQRNSDFDEVKAGIDVGPMLAAPVRVYVAYRRQGAGDYREPYPAVNQRNDWPSIFEGVVVKTLRVAASGAMRLGSSVEITADGGVNRSQNDLRVVGATRTRFDGRVRVALEPSWARVKRSLF